MASTRRLQCTRNPSPSWKNRYLEIPEGCLLLHSLQNLTKHLIEMQTVPRVVITCTIRSSRTQKRTHPSGSGSVSVLTWKGGEASTELGPTERAVLNHWTSGHPVTWGWGTDPVSRNTVFWFYTIRCAKSSVYVVWNLHLRGLKRRAKSATRKILPILLIKSPQ